MLKLDWTNGTVLWQLQPVPFDLDADPDWASPPTVGQVSCGSVALSVQKDGYVYAVDIKTGGPFSNPACSSPGHSLECPRWSFPFVAHLPFTGGTHNDTPRFIRMGALDGDRYYVIAGGPSLTSSIPGSPGSTPTNRLYSLNVCTSDADRIRWILDVPGGDDSVGSISAPSVANGVIYIARSDAFGTAATPHDVFAYADTDVLPPASFVCSYPGLPSGLSCSAAGFQNIDSDGLTEARAVGVTGDYVRALRSAGVTGDLDAFVQLRAVGLKPEYVQSLRRQGYVVRSADKLVEMWAVGIKPGDLPIAPPRPPRPPKVPPADWDPNPDPDDDGG